MITIISPPSYPTLRKTVAVLALNLLTIGIQDSFAQNTKATPVAKSSGQEQAVLDLSKKKWQWMADKDVDKLAVLFDNRAKFVHMSGTWKKDEEIDIIKTGSIWYKKADVHDVTAEIFDSTAIVWSRITLEAMVRGSEAKTEFTVTEVYKRQAADWKLLALTFSSVRDTHTIKH
ncbi:MAG: nuclear transport factor 2 family protein [Cytophagaceae bacterium]|nr:MAG: nuclear transport factor 2 family protein [Cytophagaceae bacterium]